MVSRMENPLLPQAHAVPGVDFGVIAVDHRRSVRTMQKVTLVVVYF
jgi:hypothetical protein